MQVITTYDNAVAGEFNITDFPSCKRYWPCDEGTGDTITDLVEGTILTVPNIEWVDNYVGRSSGGLVNFPVSGAAMPDLPQAAGWLAIVVGDFSLATASIMFGAAGGLLGTGDQVCFSRLNNGNRVADGVNANITAAESDINTEVAAFAYDAANVLGDGAKSLYFAEGDGATTTLVEDAVATITSDINTGANAGALSFDNTVRLYSYTYLRFVAGEFPSKEEILIGISWMNAHARAGDKSIWPGFKRFTTV